jgi:hypothetical protein
MFVVTCVETGTAESLSFNPNLAHNPQPKSMAELINSKATCFVTLFTAAALVAAPP